MGSKFWDFLFGLALILAGVSYFILLWIIDARFDDANARIDTLDGRLCAIEEARDGK